MVRVFKMDREPAFLKNSTAFDLSASPRRISKAIAHQAAESLPVCVFGESGAMGRISGWISRLHRCSRVSIGRLCTWGFSHKNGTPTNDGRHVFQRPSLACQAAGIPPTQSKRGCLRDRLVALIPDHVMSGVGEPLLPYTTLLLSICMSECCISWLVISSEAGHV